MLQVVSIDHEATVTALFHLNHETRRTAFMTREVIARIFEFDPLHPVGTAQTWIRTLKH